MIFARIRPNAQAAAGEGEATLTLAVADNFAGGSLSGCGNATAVANADGLVLPPGLGARGMAVAPSGWFRLVARVNPLQASKLKSVK